MNLFLNARSIRNSLLSAAAASMLVTPAPASASLKVENNHALQSASEPGELDQAMKIATIRTTSSLYQRKILKADSPPGNTGNDCYDDPKNTDPGYLNDPLFRMLN